MRRHAALLLGFGLGLGLGVGGASAAPLSTPLRVAAASDLAQAFPAVAAAYEQRTGQKVVFSFGASGLLSRQIAEGAPFDVFAAADVGYVDAVVKASACSGETKQLYARGRLAIWSKNAPAPASVQALADARYVKIAIANPAHAPYGRAAMQALERAGVKAAVEKRLVFGESVQQALQLAQSGNAEAALVALSLAVAAGGASTIVDDELHAPLDQALVVCGKSIERLAAAKAFGAFVNGEVGRPIMRKFGFALAGETEAAPKSR